MPFYSNGTWYPYEEFINGTMADMGAYNSAVTGNVFGVGVLILIYMVFLIAGTVLSRKDGVVVNASASFITWAVSILLVGMESSQYGQAWLPVEALYLTTFLMVISVAILYLGRGR